MKIKPRWMKAAIKAARVEAMALPKSRLSVLRQTAPVHPSASANA